MWNTVKISDICELVYGKPLEKKDRLEAGGFPAFGANGIKALSNKSIYDEPSIIIGRKGSAGAVNMVREPFWALDVTYYVKIDSKQVDLNFLFYIFKSLNLPSMAKGVKPGINRNEVYSKTIKLPPVEVQKAIVDKINSAFTFIDEVNEVLLLQHAELNKLYATSITNIYFTDEKTLKLPLNKVASIKGGKRLPKGEKLQAEETPYPYIRVTDFNDNGTIDTDSIKYITENTQKQISRYTISNNDVYISIAGTIGKTGVVPKSLDNANLTENAAKIVLSERCNRDYLYYFTTSSSFKEQIIDNTRVAAQPKLALKRLGNVVVPIHSIDEQIKLSGKAKIIKDKIEQVKSIYKSKSDELIALKLAILKEELQGN